MMKRLKQAMVVIIVLLTVMTSFPKDAMAQQGSATTFRFSNGLPPSGYYRNENLLYEAERRTAVIVMRNLHQIIIGGDPQVPGGIASYQLQADEEWYTLAEDTQSYLLSGSGKVYLGNIPAGEVVLRNKSTGEIYAVQRCGNWARGRTPPPSPPDRCEPEQLRVVNKVRIGNVIRFTVTDGCTEGQLDVPIEYDTVVDKQIECKGGYIPILQLPSVGSKVKKNNIKAQDVLAALSFTAEIEATIAGKMSNDKMAIVSVWQSVCNPDDFIVEWWTVGGERKWLWFIAGVVVGFVGGFFVGRATADCPTPMLPPTIPPKIYVPPPGNGSGQGAKKQRGFFDPPE